MTRTPHHASDIDLLNAVRDQLREAPDIGPVELRSRIRGTQSVVSAALRAALVEAGRGKPGEETQLDPRFAALIRMPTPPAPLDLRTMLSAELGRTVTEHLAATTGVIDRLVERVHEAACEAIRREHESAKALIDDAERRLSRAESFVDGLRHEAAEASAETERVRAQAARDQGAQALEVARLTRELSDALASRDLADGTMKASTAELETTRRELSEAHDERVGMARDLAAANGRVQELERHVADLRLRLDRAEAEVGAARASESEARAAAAGALAKLQVHEAMREAAEGRASAGSRKSRMRARAVSASDG